MNQVKGLVRRVRLPKSKKRTMAAPRRHIAWGGVYSKTRRRRDKLIAGAVVAVAVVAGGIYFWQRIEAGRSFDLLVAAGQSKLAQVERVRSEGGGHLRLGETRAYASRTPTSGRHDPIWTRARFYDEPQPPSRLVHALEHGNIVVYYDEPGPQARQLLDTWTGMFGGQWDGLVVTPLSGLGERLVLTAWAKHMRLERWDAAPAAAFIDAYRGRGPENPVR